MYCIVDPVACISSYHMIGVIHRKTRTPFVCFGFQHLYSILKTIRSHWSWFDRIHIYICFKLNYILYNERECNVIYDYGYKST